VLCEDRIPQVLQGRGEALGEADLFIKLPDRQQPGITTQKRLRNLNDDRFLRQKIQDKRKDRL
jgi:hypothetical protein